MADALTRAFDGAVRHGLKRGFRGAFKGAFKGALKRALAGALAAGLKVPDFHELRSSPVENELGGPLEVARKHALTESVFAREHGARLRRSRKRRKRPVLFDAFPGDCYNYLEG
jgi:hypothetical protein